MEEFYKDLETFLTTFVGKTEGKDRFSRLLDEAFGNFLSVSENKRNINHTQRYRDQNKTEKMSVDTFTQSVNSGSNEASKNSLRHRVLKEEDPSINVQEKNWKYSQQNDKKQNSPSQDKLVYPGLNFQMGDAIIERMAVIGRVCYWLMCLVVILVWLLFLPDLINLAVDGFCSLTESCGCLIEFVFRAQMMFRSFAIFLSPLFSGLFKNATMVDSDCIVANPLFSESKLESNCIECQTIRKILSPQDHLEHKPFSSRLLTNAVPVLFKGWGANTTLNEVQGHVLDHINILGRFDSRLESSVDYVEKVQDLALEDTISRLEEDRTAHVMWIPDRYMTSKVLARLIPRPPMLPNTLDLPPYKTLLIDGEDSPPFFLPQLFDDNVFYVQGSGSRSIVLTVDGCPLCSTLYAKLNPNDVLFYDSSLWTARSQPAGDSISVAVLATIRRTRDRS